MKKLRAALAKGRLVSQIASMFEAMDYDMSSVRDPGRKLILPFGSWEAVLAKSPDVITYVEHGVCELGITGKDTIMESDGAFYELLDLKLGICRFAVAALEGEDFFNTSGYKRVATKYPKVAGDFFQKLGMDVEIITLSGSVELAPLLGLSDAILDIVETGKTLLENGLVPIKDVAPVSARLIANIGAMKTRRGEMLEFMRILENQLCSK